MFTKDLWNLAEDQTEAWTKSRSGRAERSLQALSVSLTFSVFFCLSISQIGCESSEPANPSAGETNAGDESKLDMTMSGEGAGVMSGTEGGEECVPSATDPSVDGERCDEVDNDCDGEIDEGFDQLGEPCERRLMRCLSTGALVCGPDGDLICDAPAIEQGPERCDEIDNDCDGEIDEGFSLRVDRENCGACGQVCSWPQGVGRCEMGACLLTSCESGFADLNGDPADGCECNTTNDETCDGVDNDCDGIVDEGYSVGTTCIVGEGACQVRGVLACVSGDLAACDALPLEPSAEECDLLDNDCDGLTDEDFDDDGDGAPACQICDGCLMSGDPECPALCNLNDCSDEDPALSPFAWDICDDEIDQNCDGADAPCTESYEIGRAHV